MNEFVPLRNANPKLQTRLKWKNFPVLYQKYLERLPDHRAN
jgi:hypothetical protein